MQIKIRPTDSCVWFRFLWNKSCVPFDRMGCCLNGIVFFFLSLSSRNLFERISRTNNQLFVEEIYNWYRESWMCVYAVFNFHQSKSEKLKSKLKKKIDCINWWWADDVRYFYRGRKVLETVSFSDLSMSHSEPQNLRTIRKFIR